MVEHSLNQHVKTLNRALDSGTYNHVRLLLNHMPHAEVAHLLESSPPRERNILWKLLEPENEGEVLQELSEDVRAQFIKNKSTTELVTLLEDMETDDLADLLQELPNNITKLVLENLDIQNRQRAEAALAYPEDTAGGLMNTDFVTVRPDITMEVLLRYLRRLDDIPGMTDSLFVVNRKGFYVGAFPLTRALTSRSTASVRECMITDIEPIPVSMPARDVAQRFERMDLISAPVVDTHGLLVGRITIDDVIDVIREEADHSLMSLAGLEEDEDTFAPVLTSVRRRSLWLGVNLCTGAIPAFVVLYFDATIQHMVILAALMPIIANMGGVGGTQTLTLVIRGMALGQINPVNARYLIMREAAVGLISGLIWALVLGSIGWLFYNNWLLGLVIAGAMVSNLIIAAISGSCIPLLLRKMNIDPALAGGVLLTTVTDSAGFFVFLGLATLFLL